MEMNGFGGMGLGGSGQKSRMNSASKRKVSRAVKQAMRQDDEKLKADLTE